MEKLMQTEVRIYSASNPTEHIKPSIVNNFGVYQCDFNDPCIDVASLPNASISLYSYDAKKMVLSRNADAQGKTTIKFNELKLASYNFNISVFLGADKIYNYDFTLMVQKENMSLSHYIETDSNKKVIETMQDYDTSGITGEFMDAIDLKADFMSSVDEFYHAEIDVYSNSQHPTLKIYIDKNQNVEISALGYEEYMLNEPVVLNGKREIFSSFVIFTILDKIQFAGRYLLYIRIIDEVNRVLKKEVFVNLHIIFENKSVPEIIAIKDGKIYGRGMKPGETAKVFEVNMNNEFETELASVPVNEHGNFMFVIDDSYKACQTRKFGIRSLDPYGNLSQAALFDLP